MATVENTHVVKDETAGFMIRKAENGSIPDTLLRFGICKVLHDLSSTELAPGGHKYHKVTDFINDYMRTCDEVALQTQEANEQHYELPHEFFTLCLGDNFKYSQGFWPELELNEVSENPSTSIIKDVITGTSGMVRDFEKGKSVRELLTQAETNMLKITMARAEVQDKHCVLDVGCGWGAASLYILENFPEAKVVAVSNSSVQREFIMKRAQQKNCSDRILVITCNIAVFDRSQYGQQIEEFLGQAKFNRIISVGMFEHMRNWEKLINSLTEQWLQDDGKMLLDYFVHKSRAYTYEKTTWMGKYFFSGGIMPSYDLLSNLDETIGKTLEIEAAYKVNGRHYAKSSEAWLKLFYEEKDRIREIMDQVYGEEQAKIWQNRWRIYYLSLAEFFAMREGTEWFSTQYVLSPIRNN
jgi:cyclopropane-fatty-acyl-phospholipid synthase